MAPLQYFWGPGLVALYVTLVGAGAGFFGAGYAVYLAADTAWKKDIAAKEAAVEAEQSRLAAVAAAEQKRRSTVVSMLRGYYIMSHDQRSTELLSGMAWPPDEWMNGELAKLGEPWTVVSNGANINSVDRPR